MTWADSIKQCHAPAIEPGAGQAATSAPLRRRAWAKVNLTLHVTARRADGYHELDSLVVFAGVGDELTIAPGAAGSDLQLFIDGPFAESLESPAPGEAPAAAASRANSENLILLAARALRARFAVEAGAHLRLTKRLPIAAGLGGGSADAAAALLGLAQLWGLQVDPSEMAEIGAGLGADLPVCLAGRPSFVGGIGARIDPAPPLPPGWLVLVNPGAPLSTRAVFAARDGSFSRPCRWREDLADAGALADRLGACRNDLEAPARRLVPEIGEVLAVLAARDQCRLARMSGSGATCFGLFGSPDPAVAAAAEIAAERPAWWVAAAPILASGSAGAGPL